MIIDCHNNIGTDLMFYLREDFPYVQIMCPSKLKAAHWALTSGPSFRS